MLRQKKHPIPSIAPDRYDQRPLPNAQGELGRFQIRGAVTTDKIHVTCGVDKQRFHYRYH